MRKNQGKPKLAHIFHMPKALKGICTLLEWGEQKYSPVAERGWLEYDAQDTLDSLMRHVQAIINGEIIDPETELPHAYAVLFNAAMYVELTCHGPEDDCPPGTCHDHGSSSPTEQLDLT
jgi:hypothetical protein